MIRSVISISFESPYIILRRGFYTPFNLVSPLSLSLLPLLFTCFFPYRIFSYLSLTPPVLLLFLPVSPSFILSLYYFFLLYSYISVPASTFTSLPPPSFSSFIFPHGYRPSLLSFLFFSSFLSLFYPFLRVFELNYLYLFYN